MREGFPCAFMISNRVDEAVIKKIFSQIRALTGQIEPKVFMSNMAECFLTHGWLKRNNHHLDYIVHGT